MVFIAAFFAGMSFLIVSPLISFAEEFAQFTAVSGTDASSGTQKSFTETDIKKLSASDSEPGNGVDRMRSDKWPD